MNRKLFLLPLMAALGLSLGACQKQPTEAERNAEIERQVQQRLDAEHQAEEQQKLAQRQADLDARERALAAKENRPAATPAPAATAAPGPRALPENDRETSSYATFYRKLDPYGDWMETSDYGYVFQPRPAAQSRDWRPYTNGHWVYTDAGWTWISEEQFGWATYHYGRWIRLRIVGWVWVPGEQWAPAWVSWRKGNDYVGWAPLPPEAQFDRQTGIRNWADNYYDIGPEQYAFVRANDFGAKVSAHVVVPTQQNVTIINQTTNITNITYNNSVIVDRGPSYDELRARSSQPLERFRLERTQDTNIERPVFRGEVVTVPTVDFHPAERAARPPRVSQTIAQPVVERGWSGTQDAEAAQKARHKMQAEATPPPNAPPKRFVRPEPNPVIPPRSPAPATTVAPVSTPVFAPATPVATPAKPERPNRPGAKPHPTVATSPAEGTPATPNDATTTPAPPRGAARNQRQENAPAQEARRKERQEAQAQRRAERGQKMEGRRAGKPERPETSPANQTPAATAAPPAPTETTPSASPASNRANPGASRRERREARKARRGEANPEASPEASASPEAKQP